MGQPTGCLVCQSGCSGYTSQRSEDVETGHIWCDKQGKLSDVHVNWLCWTFGQAAKCIWNQTGMNNEGIGSVYDLSANGFRHLSLRCVNVFVIYGRYLLTRTSVIVKAIWRRIRPSVGRPIMSTRNAVNNFPYVTKSMVDKQITRIKRLPCFLYLVHPKNTLIFPCI